MTIRLQDVVRSEEEGGLAGPANPIPSQSIDCGCKQLPCPKLAKFATRRLFVGLLSWVGLIQAAAYAYFYIAGPTIARRFQFDPYIIEWVILISDLTPFLLGIPIAYWGDRIHRAAWIGAIVLLQSVSYFIMIIPHLTHYTKVIEETKNVTHMSLYPDDNRELCAETSSRIVAKDDAPCYLTFGIFVVVQITSGVANIAYLALGISYLDDNTKKRHIAAFIGVLLAVKIFGVLLGCFLAWSCLGIDAVSLSPIKSYREQIGAWWLGLPILTILLIVPGLLLSWFPRMLPSEVVEKAAASLLNNSDRRRTHHRLASQNVGSPNYWPSLGRLITNKILILQILACTLSITAIVNFMGYENLIAQSRFHVPTPTGMLLGFEDPMSSRVISNILKPILVGLIVIVSGFIIAKARPNAVSMICYSIIILLLAAAIIFSLSAASCEKKTIVEMARGSPTLLRYCNLNCGCSNDANFRPVCDSKGMFIFYSPCHAGCTSSELKNGVTTYSGCSCVEEETRKVGPGTTEAIDGPCTSSNCQISWLIFGLGIFLIYVMVATTFVGDLLIILRSVNVQDKAISIGFWMTCSAIIVNVPGKMIYELIANLTCQYWGTRGSQCHLHDGFKLGNYLYYLTGSLFVLSAILKIFVCLLSKELKVYAEKKEVTKSSAEMQEMIRHPAATPKQQEPGNAGNDTSPVQVEVTNEMLAPSTSSPIENPPVEEDVKQTEEAQLKYGPLGPGDRRTNSKSSLNQLSQTGKSDTRGLDSEDELSSSDEDQKKGSSTNVEYRPLDIDSDVESDLSSVEPRSRKRIISKDYEPVYNNDQSVYAKAALPKYKHPNPNNDGDSKLNKAEYKDQNENADGFSKTSSFEFSRKRPDDGTQNKGDFNEVGIPIVDPPSPFLKGVQSLINRYELNTEEQSNGDEESVLSGESGRLPEGKIVSGIPLVAMASKRPSSRVQSSSGVNSLSGGRIPETRPQSPKSVSSKTSSKGSTGTLHTDL
ncbi:Solute carrier organic anion transporter family member 1A5 [Habropoda laboriosa]|uniref:Solute carrier organic anion transporter family member 1A5 n=1 Tax=Habropoda laboriosa TaxID=597456 RepID=A0A0L7R3Z7_9HYME|nr:PREDICTED: solute carrier organic anion transporter family member 1A5 [Habropoda laboriosa]KOC65602.1 Solute carrier organic anion transporter family member 1A5 [Habropoda laboriosa]